MRYLQHIISHDSATSPLTWRANVISYGSIDVVGGFHFCVYIYERENAPFSLEKTLKPRSSKSPVDASYNGVPCSRKET